jgi:small subunit ribosomal protein S6
LRQDIATSEIKKVTEKIRKVIEEHGGSILKEEYWGLRSLAYPIKKSRKGHYIMLILDVADETALVEMRRIIGLSDDIIRDLIVKIKSFDNKDSIMLSQPEQEERNAF